MNRYKYYDRLRCYIFNTGEVFKIAMGTDLQVRATVYVENGIEMIMD